MCGVCSVGCLLICWVVFYLYEESDRACENAYVCLPEPWGDVKNQAARSSVR